MSDEPRPKRPRPYRRSRFYGLQHALTKRGISALDGRSSAARAVARWKAEIAADLGGDLSTAKRTLLEMAAQDVALLAVADAWLRTNAGGVINRKRRTFVPLVAERLRVASHLADTLRLLGLERVPEKVPTLGELVREWEERKAAEAPALAQEARVEAREGEAPGPAPDEAQAGAGEEGEEVADAD